MEGRGRGRGAGIDKGAWDGDVVSREARAADRQPVPSGLSTSPQ